MTRLTFSTFVAAATLLTGASAQSTASQYGQCGGIGYSGATLCPTGWTCTYSNDWYSQCLPGASTAVGSTSSTSKSTSTGSATATIKATTTTSTASSGTATLLPDWLWIRAVTDPDFHKYLQSYHTLAAGDAILGATTTAGQFNVISGQLVHYLPSGSLLYANVEPRADSTIMKLKVSFSSTPATVGTFAWSGDALTWTIPSITRPNNAAWLTCPDAEGAVLYANLGSYGYMTPSGCYDHTIHFYNGATAVS